MKSTQTLHGEMICGRRLKVLPAEPAKDDVSRKRVKMDYWKWWATNGFLPASIFIGWLELYIY